MQGASRHERLLIEKRDLIKESLDNMVEYRAKKIDQVQREIDILVKEIQITDFKIDSAKMMSKELLSEIRESQKPKVHRYELKNSRSNNSRKDQKEVSNFDSSYDRSYKGGNSRSFKSPRS